MLGGAIPGKRGNATLVMQEGARSLNLWESIRLFCLGDFGGLWIFWVHCDPGKGEGGWLWSWAEEMLSISMYRKRGFCNLGLIDTARRKIVELEFAAGAIKSRGVCCEFHPGRQGASAHRGKREFRTQLPL